MSDPATLLAWAMFISLAIVTVGAAILVVTLRNLFHSVIALVTSLLGIAGLFLMLSAEFVAAIHVLIYVGAIATLFIFVIMLTTRIEDSSIRQTNEQAIPTLIVVAGLLAVILSAIALTAWTLNPAETAPGVNDIGKEMLTRYILPFEVVSLLLLAALVGAVMLARREPKS
jgi:NADH-quinone oxidoreductase subunit J